MSDIVLKILGSASAKPTPVRNQSAHVLDVRGSLFLIDCGEGAQIQMVRMGISPLRIEAVFLSHLHGDHVFGIFGLLSTMEMLGRVKPLRIFAPEAFGEVLSFYLSHFSYGDIFRIEFIPLSSGPQVGPADSPALGPQAGPADSHTLEPQVGPADSHASGRGTEPEHFNLTGPEKILDTGTMEVFAFPLRHKVPTFGFLFREKERPLNVSKEAIAKYGLSIEEIKSLKAGHDVVRGGGVPVAVSNEGPVGGEAFSGVAARSDSSDSMVVSVEEATRRPSPPRSYAYCSDTGPFPELAQWVRGVDLLYHEATFPQSMADLAALTFHSTTRGAAMCALHAGVGRLVVGHYSSRFSDVGFFLDELRSIFPASYLASDGDVFEI